MIYTVEKIGGTSMTAFDAVLDNILIKDSEEEMYNRVFVVSAYSGITDALLECKKTSKPGVYQLVAKREDNWQQALDHVEQQMLLTNEHMFADPMNRMRADKFIRSRISEAKVCISNILETCQYGQFSLRHYLPQVREFLASIGEAHSAYNTALKLKNMGYNARFVDYLAGTHKCQQVWTNVFSKHFQTSIQVKNFLLSLDMRHVKKGSCPLMTAATAK